MKIPLWRYSCRDFHFFNFKRLLKDTKFQLSFIPFETKSGDLAVKTYDVENPVWSLNCGALVGDFRVQITG